MVVACAAYFSQLRSDLVIELLFERGWEWERLGWHGVLEIMLPWFLLAVFYVRTRLHIALIAHCLGAIVSFAIMTLLLLINEPGEFPNAGKNLTMVPVLGCFASTLFSFPLSVLMILILACRWKPTETE